LETIEHVIQEHYLMVKLNPLSRAERVLDGVSRRELQRRGATAYVPCGCPHRVRYEGPIGSLHLMTLQPTLVDGVAEDLNIRQINIAPRFAHKEDPFVLAIAEQIYTELEQGNPHGPLFAETFARSLAAYLLTHFRGGKVAADKLPTLGRRRFRELDAYI